MTEWSWGELKVNTLLCWNLPAMPRGTCKPREWQYVMSAVESKVFLRQRSAPSFVLHTSSLKHPSKSKVELVPKRFWFVSVHHVSDREKRNPSHSPSLHSHSCFTQLPNGCGPTLTYSSQTNISVNDQNTYPFNLFFWVEIFKSLIFLNRIWTARRHEDDSHPAGLGISRFHDI